MKSRITAILILSVLSLHCTRQSDFIRETIADAEIQISHLASESTAGDTVRIPSTFRNDKIRYVPERDWVSGFFAGTLWYMYELTGKEEYADAARTHTEKLHKIQYLTSHHDVGFMIGCSYGNGRRIKGIEEYDTVIVNAARSLATRFRPGAGVIQSWNTTHGWQAQKGWKCPVIIDNLMNLELLFEAAAISGDNSFRDIAISHADRTLENHYRSDFSTYHVVDYDDVTGEVRGRCTAQGIADESSWARGQAWSLYGLNIMYRYTKDEKYLKHAEAVADYLYVKEENMPEDLVPLWDYDVVEYSALAPMFQPYTQQRDVSSAAICASALYELFWSTGKDFYKETADKVVKTLSTDTYKAEPGTNGGFILKHSVGSIPHGGNIDVPLNYADYYFLEAILRKDRIEKGRNPIF